MPGRFRPPFRAEMGCFCVCSAQVQEVAKNSLRGVPESVVMSYSYFVELPRLEDIEPGAHTDVLIANSRVDQGRIRAAVEAVFDAHPALGTVFEPRVDTLTSRPGGGGWGWGVEPPGAAVAEVIARHSASFDMYTGRLFAVSLLPGSPDRLVLTASRLCVDDAYRAGTSTLSSYCLTRSSTTVCHEASWCPRRVGEPACLPKGRRGWAQNRGWANPPANGPIRAV